MIRVVVGGVAASDWWTAAVPFMAVAATLLAAALAAWAALWVNGRTVFVDAVTKERAEWRADLREATAKLVGITHQWVKTREEGELHAVRTAIRLRLNPIGGNRHPLDQVLLEALWEHESAQYCRDVQKALTSLAIIQRGVQLLLKSEWEKSKNEARDGRLAAGGTDRETARQDLDAARRRFLSGQAKGTPGPTELSLPRTNPD